MVGEELGFVGVLAALILFLMLITGSPLPFFSYGGSFFLVCCMSVGLVLRAAWDARLSGYADV